MKVLSLFDGIACGMLAMQKAGVEVDRYVAFEYDEESANAQKGRPFGFAALTASHNFPMIEQCGNVFSADFSEFSDFDFLVGGSPCTYWSIAQKNNRETEASGLGWELFSQYVRALHEAKPKFFIYENNKSMSKAIRASIDEAVCINSALVSAQNRQRLYWVGKRNDDGTYSKVNVEQPEDRGILLKDVLDGMTDREKGRCVIGSAGRTTTREYFLKQQGTMAFEPCCSTVLNVNPSGKGMNGAVGRVDAKSRCLTTNKGEGPKVIVPVAINTTAVTTGFRPNIAEPVCVAERGRYNEDGIVEQRFEARKDGKTNVLTTVQKDNNVAEPLPRATAIEWDEGGKPIKAISRADGKTYDVYEVASFSHPHGWNDGIFTYEKFPNLTTGSSCRQQNVLVEPLTEENKHLLEKPLAFCNRKYEVKDNYITIKGRKYPIKLPCGFYIIRKLTVRECMRLQTVPEWYKFPVSDSQAYKMLGNGWTVDVIVHLITSALGDK